MCIQSLEGFSGIISCFPYKGVSSERRYAPRPAFQAAGKMFSVVVEAMLIGHEDWVYSVAWQPRQDTGDARPCLLSASMDRTMALWRPDISTGTLILLLYLMKIVCRHTLKRLSFLSGTPTEQCTQHCNSSHILDKACCLFAFARIAEGG